MLLVIIQLFVKFFVFVKFFPFCLFFVKFLPLVLLFVCLLLLILLIVFPCLFIACSYLFLATPACFLFAWFVNFFPCLFVVCLFSVYDPLIIIIVMIMITKMIIKNINSLWKVHFSKKSIPTFHKQPQGLSSYKG